MVTQIFRSVLSHDATKPKRDGLDAAHFARVVEPIRDPRRVPQRTVRLRNIRFVALISTTVARITHVDLALAVNWPTGSPPTTYWPAEIDSQSQQGTNANIAPKIEKPIVTILTPRSMRR